MKIRRYHLHVLQLRQHLMNRRNLQIRHVLIHRCKIRTHIIKFKNHSKRTRCSGPEPIRPRSTRNPIDCLFVESQASHCDVLPLYISLKSRLSIFIDIMNIDNEIGDIKHVTWCIGTWWCCILNAAFNSNCKQNSETNMIYQKGYSRTARCRWASSLRRKKCVAEP